MKSQKYLLPVALLAIMMLFVFSAAAMADDLDDLPYPTGSNNMQSVASYILQGVGLKSANIGTFPADHNAMARSVGMLQGITFNATAVCSQEDFEKMKTNARPLFEALRADPPAPFFVNGMAQPIFPYGNSTYYDTSGEGAARFVVYVETNYDSDADGKLDLIKVMVQLPRAAVDKGMKVASIYHAQPYNEGTNDGVSYPANIRTEGTNWLNANGPFPHEMLHGTAPPRVPVGEMTTQAMVATANWRDWRYTYSYAGKPAVTATVTWGVTNGNQVSSLNAHDYFLVRGYALISTAGLSTVAGEGLATYGADIEIDAYKCVIDWLNGTAKAYTDKTSNIEIKADWSNGLVGMTGTSYGGTTPVGLATSGVKGLETIIPVCGISSYYEYQNQQGAINWDPQYTPGMVWYILSRFGAPDWYSGSPIRGRQMGYMQQMYLEAVALTGNYGEHWALRDYTLDGWYKDWGPSKLRTPMLIVHGTNDNNVRPKQSVLMYQMAQKAGVEARFMWNQGHHMTPNNHQIGAYTYQEWQNLWYSHYLYKVDNHVLEQLPELYAQSNLTGNYEGYDSWETEHKLILDDNNRVVASSSMAVASFPVYEEPVEYKDDYYLLGGLPPADIETVATVNSAETDIGLPVTISMAAAADKYITLDSARGSASWQNFLNLPTAASTLYSIVLPQDLTVRGVVAVNFRAALATLGSNLNTNIAQVRVHAKLVEIARTGTTLRYYGGNAVGSTISTATTVSGGVYRGGGLSSSNIVQFTATTNGTYRELARGWMNLAHPDSGYDSISSHIDNRINLRDNIGVFHDYTLYLQPIVHTARAGNRLALILTTGGDNSAAYTGNNAFTFTIDNEASFVTIPVEQYLPSTVDVNFPGVTGVSVQYYDDIASSWVDIPGTYDNTCRFLLPEGVDMTALKAYKEGMSYQFAGFEMIPANLVLDVPPSFGVVIDAQPYGAAVVAGTVNDINVAAYANDGGVLSYQWYGDGLPIAGATGATLTVDNPDYGAHEYYVVITSATVSADGAPITTGIVTSEIAAMDVYPFMVYMQAEQSGLAPGDILYVDVMLTGDINYTQINTAINYDAAVLEFTGYANLAGLAAQVMHDGATVSIRSVPTLNMLQGAPCRNPVRIVTLEFTVNEEINAAGIATELVFDAIAVLPAAGYAGIATVLTKTLSVIVE